MPSIPEGWERLPPGELTPELIEKAAELLRSEWFELHVPPAIYHFDLAGRSYAAWLEVHADGKQGISILRPKAGADVIPIQGRKK